MLSAWVETVSGQLLTALQQLPSVSVTQPKTLAFIRSVREFLKQFQSQSQILQITSVDSFAEVWRGLTPTQTSTLKRSMSKLDSPWTRSNAWKCDSTLLDVLVYFFRPLFHIGLRLDFILYLYFAVDTLHCVKVCFNLFDVKKQDFLSGEELGDIMRFPFYNVLSLT